MPETVLITGSSGFIAQHIVKLLVIEGYNVIGTVRLESKGSKLKKNLESVKPGRFTYELVPDMAVPGAFDDILQKHKIDVVLHTASPFFYESTDPERDLIIPAIEGTESIFRCIQKQVQSGIKNIKRVVLTSSDAAVYSAEDEQKPNLVFDEASWNEISYSEAVKDPISAYYGAKTFAEKKAWEIAQETEGFPILTTVNPVWVFGPQAFDNEAEGELNTSNEIIRGLLRLKENDTFSNDTGGFIDVRDVARAHVLAFQKEEAAGKRLFMNNDTFSIQMIIDVIHKRFPEYKIPKGTPGSGEQDIATLGKKVNSKTREVLGFEFVAFEEMIVDIVSQIRDNGK